MEAKQEIEETLEQVMRKLKRKQVMRNMKARAGNEEREQVMMRNGSESK